MNSDQLQLRPRQEMLVEALREAFRSGKRAIVLYAPTGAGKTEIAIYLMRAAAEKQRKAAMVLDRVVLCDQTSKRLDKYRIDHGVLQSGHWRFRPYERIQVCSAQTLEKRGSFPGLDLMVVDECHSQREQTSEFIKSNKEIKVIGLSATPFAKGMGKVYEGVVCCVTTAELVEEKLLAPLKVFVCKEIDMTGAKKVAGEWSDGEVSKRGVQITGDIVAEWIKKSTEIFGGPRKTIVFCAGVAHGQDLAEKFAAAGYDFRAISYKTDEQLKKDTIDDFSRPDTQIHGLIATDILTKGFDCSDVQIGISARPFSKSLASHIQQLGRVMRSHPGKEFALWLDHSGNYLGFEEQWHEVYHNGVHDLDDGKEKPRKERTENEKEQAKCPKCSAFWAGSTDTCMHCGFVRIRKSAVEVAPGEMQEVTGKKKKAAMPEKQDFYSMLLWIKEQYGYAPGWVAHKYRAQFDVWPRGLNEVPLPASVEVLKWVKSQQIKWSKGKDKEQPRPTA